MKKLISIAASLLIAFAPVSVLAGSSPSTDSNGGSSEPAKNIDLCAVSNPVLGAKGCMYYLNGQIVTANGDNQTVTTAAGNIIDANGNIVGNIYGGGAGAAGTAGAAGGTVTVTASQYQFTFQHDYWGFGGVYVDGNWVDPSNYDSWRGSTVVQLKQSYINTLSDGVHTLTVTWADGTSASQQFTVSRTRSGVPNTSDTDNSAYYIMMGGALIVMAGAGYVLATNK